jgi:hypothetical protein
MISKVQKRSYTADEVLWIQENLELPHKTSHKIFCQKFNRNISLVAYRGQIQRRGIKKESRYNENAIGWEYVNKKGYVVIKISKSDVNGGKNGGYVMKHIYLWEKENGKLQRDMCLKCLDGNRQNTNPTNWEIIPRGILPLLNGHRGYNYDDMPNELKPAILTLAKVRGAKTKMLKRQQHAVTAG